MNRRNFLSRTILLPAAPLIGIAAATQDKPDEPITLAMVFLEEIKKYPHLQYVGFTYPTHCKCGAQAKGQLGFAQFKLTGPRVGTAGSQHWKASFFSTPVGFGSTPLEAIRKAARETLDLLRKGRDYTCRECRGESVITYRVEYSNPYNLTDIQIENCSFTQIIKG